VNILFIARASLYKNRGGDTVQVTNTMRYLEKLGVRCTVKLSHETIDYSPYDLIHFFNIIRPADILYHAAKSRKPYVVSTIFVDYSEFDKKMRGGWSGMLFRLLPSGTIEYLKAMARAIFNREKIISREYLWRGHSNSVKKVIGAAALLLPNSLNEYRRLSACYGIEHAYRVVPNAVDTEIFDGHEAGAGRSTDLVLCVGRIEGLKNQLSLIRALNHTNYQLYLIGSAATNQQDYYRQCRKEAGSNIHFIENLPQEALADYYSRAKVHVLPSWFETTGLSSLEAAAMGCNIVITDKGDTREYFEDLAFYCDPASPESIAEAVKKAASSPVDPALKAKVQTQYNWNVTAEKTSEAYRLVLAQ
jgi:glycosyltransferase involved in cell wall biosynthesis